MHRRARTALIGASFGIVLLILTWYLRGHLGIVQRADRSILVGFAGLDRPRLNQLTNFVAGLCNPNPYLLLAAIPILVALARRRPRVAAMIGVVILGANATTQQLKPLLAESHGGLLPGLAPASFPSGHATAAMSLALCSVIAAPARWRPRVAAVMAAFAVAVCYSFLELRWHYPSDVLGGFLVAGTWTLLGTAALSLIDARWPRAGRQESGRATPVPLGRALAPVVVVLLVALAFAALLAIARPHAVVTYARAHEAFIIGAAGIGAVALMMATAAMLAFRRDPPEA